MNSASSKGDRDAESAPSGISLAMPIRDWQLGVPPDCPITMPAVGAYREPGACNPRTDLDRHNWAPDRLLLRAGPTDSILLEAGGAGM